MVAPSRRRALSFAMPVLAMLLLGAPARGEHPPDMPFDPIPETQVTQPEPDTPLDKGNLQSLDVGSITARADGVAVDLSGRNTALVRVLAPDLVHVAFVRDGATQPPMSPGILKRDWADVSFTRSDAGGVYALTTSDVRVEIAREPFAIRLLDARTGAVINEDDTRWGSSGFEDGKPYVFKRTDADENFYGWGEQTRGLNKRGESIGLWNTDAYSYTRQTKYIYDTIPFFIGLRNGRAYGLMFDNTWRSYYEMATDDESFYDFYANGGPLSYYLFAGPRVPDIVARYTELTGRFPQPPQWSLGWQQSKWQYTREDILDVARKYREKGIPLDVMHLDIDYMDAFRVFTWGAKVEATPDSQTREHGGYIGDPYSLHDELDALHLHTIAINDPAVKVDPDYDVYRSGENGRTALGDNFWTKKADGSDFVGSVWPGPSKFPDFFRPEVRNWWAGFHNRLFDPGIDGIWLDMNEPAVFDGPFHTMPLDNTFDHGQISHRAGHNLYGFWETEATKRAFDRFKPNERPFILTRDMYSGSQRWAALWTGDNVSNWEHLRMSLPMNMNIGLSGVPMVGNDIGGFAQRPSAELMKRWLEVGALLPFARDHYDSDLKSTIKQGQEPFAEVFGGDQGIETVARRYIRLRYELLPYMQNLFREAELTGAPIWRPLLFEFQDDERTYDVEDQYMFGDRIMVAPIVDQGKERRRVYLPRGSRWVDYWTGQTYAGGRYLERQTGIETLPLYVRGGSIIPRRETQLYTGEKPLTNLTLDTWMSRNGTAATSYYEDDGATKDYQEGEYNQTRFEVRRTGDAFAFTAQPQHRGFDSPTSMFTLQLHNVTDSPVPGSTAVAAGKRRVRLRYDRATRTLRVKMPATTRKLRFKVR
jgi:alpha-glucosidase